MINYESLLTSVRELGNVIKKIAYGSRYNFELHFHVSTSSNQAFPVYHGNQEYAQISHDFVIKLDSRVYPFPNILEIELGAQMAPIYSLRPTVLFLFHQIREFFGALLPSEYSTSDKIFCKFKIF